MRRTRPSGAAHNSGAAHKRCLTLVFRANPILLLIVGWFPVWSTAAAMAQGTAAQYQRTAELGSLTRGGVRNESVTLHWFGDQDRYAWYESETPAGDRDVFVIDTEDGRKLAAEDSEAYRNEFGAPDPEADDRSPSATPLRRIEPSLTTGESMEFVIENKTTATVKLQWNDPTGRRVAYADLDAGATRRQHTYAGHVWVLADKDDRSLAAFRARPGMSRFVFDDDTPRPLEPRRRGGGARRERRQGGRGNQSPDGKHRVEFRNDNVLLVRIGAGETSESNDQQAGVEERFLTYDGLPDDGYGGPVWWSPDGQHFATFRTVTGDRRKLTLVESAPADRLQPQVIEVDYPKPGDRIDHPRLHLFGIDGQTHHVVDDSLAPTPYAVTDVSWHPSGREVRMLYNQRGHQRLAVLAIDVDSGSTRPVIDETSETFIDYAGKRYLGWLDATDEVVWMSERSGWNHLYLIRQSTGEVIRPLTAGEYVVREVVELDPESRTMLLSVGGFHADQDPYHAHLIRISLDGGPPVALTAGDGHHSWEFSPSDRHLVARYSRVDLPPVTEIRDAESGRLICEVERADATRLQQVVGHLPRRFVAPGRDGETAIYGMIVFPHDFDPADQQRYPVLELIYAGPHSAHVPKAFGTFVDLRKTADLGFIVVRIDGMGTSHRDKAFHDVCWRNLADAGFPDRIAWLRAAADEIPQMDLGRVGIWGGSAGGQNAVRALIDHGDFYHAAFADCGCHDNRMDKIWWNELWMGWPIGPHYEQQSNVTGAHKINGKLMLAVGELDRNVDPSSTLQLVDALIKADKDFDLLFIPGAGHGAGGGAYGDRRRRDFFVRALWGAP